MDRLESQKDMQQGLKQKLYGATVEGGVHVSPYHCSRLAQLANLQ